MDEKVVVTMKPSEDELSPRKKYAILSILILSYFIDGEYSGEET